MSSVASHSGILPFVRRELLWNFASCCRADRAPPRVRRCCGLTLDPAEGDVASLTCLGTSATHGGSVTDDDLAAYRIGFVITWIVTFIGSWIYCIAAYGFLFGVGLGWLPSAIVATVAAFLWPLIALCVLVVGGLVYFDARK